MRKKTICTLMIMCLCISLMGCGEQKKIDEATELFLEGSYVAARDLLSKAKSDEAQTLRDFIIDCERLKVEAHACENNPNTYKKKKLTDCGIDIEFTSIHKELLPEELQHKYVQLQENFSETQIDLTNSKTIKASYDSWREAESEVATLFEGIENEESRQSAEYYRDSIMGVEGCLDELAGYYEQLTGNDLIDEYDEVKNRLSEYDEALQSINNLEEMGYFGGSENADLSSELEVIRCTTKLVSTSLDWAFDSSNLLKDISLEIYDLPGRLKTVNEILK